MVISESTQQRLLAIEEALITDPALSGEDIDALFLAQHYELTNENARILLDCAFRKGLLKKLGPGFFTQNPPDKPKITSVFQHAAKSGLKPKSIVRSVETVPAPKIIAEKLRVDTAEPIYQQKRSRLINNLVVANQCNSIPFCVTLGLENLDLENQSFQVILETKYHAIVHAIQEDYTLANPTDEDQKVLSLKQGSQVVVIHRLSLSTTNMPLVWADIHVNPVHFHLVENLWPDAAQLLRSLDSGGTS